jgi:hypothetical protein
MHSQLRLKPRISAILETRKPLVRRLRIEYNACVVLARSSREMAVESIRNSFAAHS